MKIIRMLTFLCVFGIYHNAPARQAQVTEILTSGKPTTWFYSYADLLVKTQNFSPKQGEEVVLFIDDYPLKTINTRTVTPSTFHFELDSKVLRELFLKSKKALTVSVGIKGQPPIKSAISADIRFYNKGARNVAIGVVLVLLVICFIWLFYKPDNLKDSGEKFSLSTVILIFWSMVILFTTIYFTVSTGQLPIVTSTILALLTISGATSVGSRLVGNKGNVNSQSILTSGETPKVQVHRLQSVAFNLVYGIYFIYQTTAFFEQPEFDANALMLLGVSNGVFVGIKPSEQ